MTVWGTKHSIDKNSHAAIGIDYPHHAIHDGESFTAYYSRTTAATNGHRSAIYLKTPTLKEIHMTLLFGASAAATFSICEGVTIDINEGSSVTTIYNRDRNSSLASTILDNATTPAANKYTTWDETQIAAANLNTGTILRTLPIITGVGANAVNGNLRETQEFILKKDTKYLFLITNTAASANVHTIIMDWYEHVSRGLPAY